MAEETSDKGGHSLLDKTIQSVVILTLAPLISGDNISLDTFRSEVYRMRID